MSMKINDKLLMWWLVSLVRAAFSHNIYKYKHTLKGLSVTQLIVCVHATIIQGGWVLHLKS